MLCPLGRASLFADGLFKSSALVVSALGCRDESWSMLPRRDCQVIIMTLTGTVER